MGIGNSPCGRNQVLVDVIFIESWDFMERLWRNVKYEKIYLNPPRDGMDLYLILRSTLIITTMRENISPLAMKDPLIYLKEHLDNYISFVENLS
jgi:hypothetical protein